MRATLLLFLTACSAFAGPEKPAARPVRTEIFAPDGRRIGTAVTQPRSTRTEIFAPDGRRIGTVVTTYGGRSTYLAPDGRVLGRWVSHR